MGTNPPARRILATLACLLAVAPTIAGWAHDRAHHLTAPGFGFTAADPDHDEDHGHDAQGRHVEAGGHDHGLLPSSGGRTIGGDHADSDHQADRIGSGVSSRADLLLATGAAGDLLQVAALRAEPPVEDRDRRPAQTHHPPSLPRGPPGL